MHFCYVLVVGEKLFRGEGQKLNPSPVDTPFHQYIYVSFTWSSISIKTTDQIKVLRLDLLIQIKLKKINWK